MDQLQSLEEWTKDFRARGFSQCMADAKSLARSWSDQLGLDVSLSDTFPEGRQEDGL